MSGPQLVGDKCTGKEPYSGQPALRFHTSILCLKCGFVADPDTFFDNYQEKNIVSFEVG